MSKQKTPNVYVLDNANLGTLTPAGQDNAGLNVDQAVFPTSRGIALNNKCEFNLTDVLTVTSAQVLALNATPITVLAAPGAGYAIVINKVIAKHAAGAAYAGVAAGEDLVLKYTDASGAECSGQIETTGFMDQTSAQIRSVLGVAVAPVANAAIVIHLLVGEITTGDTDLVLLIDYDIIPTDL